MLCAAQSGCASETGSQIALGPNTSSATASGDWDDIDAAVLAGADKTEWVVAQWWWSDPDTRNYALRNAAGTKGAIRIRRLTGDSASPIEIAVSVGPFGDAAAEQAIIRQIERRFDQLRGVDAATIN